MAGKRQKHSQSADAPKLGKKKRRRWPGILLGFLLGVLILAGIAYLFRDRLARPVAEGQASKALGCRVRIGSLATQPFSGKASARRLSIFSPPGFPEEKFISAGSIAVDFELMSMLGGDVLLRQVEIVRPTLHLITALDGSSNLSLFLERFTGGEPGPAKGMFELDKFEVVEGAINLIDRRDPRALMNLVVDKLSLEMGPVSSFDYPRLAPGPFKLEAVVTRNERRGFVAITGNMAVVGGEVDFDLDVHALGVDLSGISIETGAGSRVVFKQGVLNFRSQATCKNNRLSSDNQLIIEDMKLASSGGLTGMLLGVPVATCNTFISSTKGELYVPFTVKGTLAQPEVNFARSFQSVVAAGPQQMLKLAQQATNTVFDLGTDLGQAALDLGFTGLAKGLGVAGKATGAAVGVAGKTIEGAAKTIGKLLPLKPKKRKKDEQ